MDRVALVRSLLGVSLLVASAGASAQAWSGPAATFAHPLGGTLSVEGPFSVWPALPDGNGGASVRGGQNARFPGGARPTFNLSRAITPAAMAAGLRVAARLSGPVSLGLLVLEGVRWANDRWEWSDEPAPPGRWWYNGFGGCGNITHKCTYQVALQEGSSATCTGGGGEWVGCHVRSITLRSTSGDPEDPNSTVRYQVEYGYHKANPTPGDSDLYTGRFNLTGSPAEDAPDDAREWEPASDAQLQSAIADALADDPAKAGDALQAALNNGASISDFSPGPVEVDGPSSVQGPSTMSTHVGPEGTTTTTNNTTYNINYQGSTISIVEAVTTTVTHPDSTTETTTTETEPAEGEGSPAEQEAADPCELNPDASGCAPLGEPLPVDPLLAEERTFSIEPEMDAAGSCPAPIPLSFMSWSGEFSYGFICALAEGVRPLVLIFSWMGAAIWVFAVGRGG